MIFEKVDDDDYGGEVREIVVTVGEGDDPRMVNVGLDDWDSETEIGQSLWPEYDSDADDNDGSCAPAVQNQSDTPTNVRQQSKRARTRLRAKRSNVDKLFRAAWESLSDQGVHELRPSSQEEVCTDVDLRTALEHFRAHQKLASPDVLPEAWTIDDVKRSSAGIRNWLDYNPDAMYRVGDQVFPADLRGLWARQALCAANEKPQCRRQQKAPARYLSRNGHRLSPPHFNSRSLHRRPDPGIGATAA